uniref:Uncharacterized protein n=1 Tax=Anguilla anguilla TaxID=7936 RepID=A0A0E9XKC9_ANGAN
MTLDFLKDLVLCALLVLWSGNWPS